MRHHRGAKDRDRYIKRVAVESRHEARHHLRDRRLRPQDFNAEADGDHGDQRQHKRLDGADAEALKPEQQQGIPRGDQYAREQRNVKQQVEPDRGAQDFGQVAGGDGDLAEHPQREIDAPWIGFATGLGQVAASDDPQPRA